MRKVVLDLSIFVEKKPIRRHEDGCIYTALHDNRYYIIEDAGIMADFLEGQDAETIDNSAKVYEFENKLEMENFISQHYMHKDEKFLRKQ